MNNREISDMENPDIVTRIKNKLAEIEAAENVRIILAAESGSREWGFASADSDYDVRFIYVRRPEDYIRLNPLRDVIEWQLDDVYDVYGWDLQKAMRLMYESNPALHEWCNSPIIYMENELAEPLRKLTAECFLPKKALYYYLSMAKRNYSTYLTRDEFRIKKYFYALRPVLAARWVMDKGTPPPIPFGELVSAEMEPGLRPAAEELVRIKKDNSKYDSGSSIPELDEYIREQLKFIKEAADKAEDRRNDWDRLEEFFRSAVM